jgi:hypothetical protein
LPCPACDLSCLQAIMEAAISSSLSHPNIVQVGPDRAGDGCACSPVSAAAASQLACKTRLETNTLLLPGLILQTYTYAIRPIMDKTRSDLDSSLVVT